MKKIILTLCLLSCWVLLQAQDAPLDFKGTKVPAFELVDINGNTISSDNTQGKVVVLNFWFIGCKPCREEIPELNEVYEKYAEHPEVVFASIALDERDKVTAKLKRYNIHYPLVTDGALIAELFQITGYPTNFVIGRDGNYFFRFTGGLTGIGSILGKSIEKALKISAPLD